MGGSNEPGRMAFEAYNAKVGGTTFDGKPLHWGMIGERQREGWAAVEKHFRLDGSVGRPVGHYGYHRRIVEWAWKLYRESGYSEGISRKPWDSLTMEEQWCWLAEAKDQVDAEIRANTVGGTHDHSA